MGSWRTVLGVVAHFLVEEGADVGHARAGEDGADHALALPRLLRGEASLEVCNFLELINRANRTRPAFLTAKSEE